MIMRINTFMGLVLAAFVVLMYGLLAVGMVARV